MMPRSGLPLLRFLCSCLAGTTSVTSFAVMGGIWNFNNNLRLIGMIRVQGWKEVLLEMRQSLSADIFSRLYLDIW